MSITLYTTDGPLLMSVDYDGDVDLYSARVDFPEWKAYRAKGEGPGRRGMGIEVQCEPYWDTDEPHLGSSQAYSACLQ